MGAGICPALGHDDAGLEGPLRGVLVLGAAWMIVWMSFAFCGIGFHDGWGSACGDRDRQGFLFMLCGLVCGSNTVVSVSVLVYWVVFLGAWLLWGDTTFIGRWFMGHICGGGPFRKGWF